MHDRDGAGETGEEGRFLERAVAANDDHVPPAEEEAVAGRAPGDAVARQILVAGNAELAVAGAHGEHNRVGEVGLAVHDDLLRESVRSTDVTSSATNWVPKRSAGERSSS